MREQLEKKEEETKFASDQTNSLPERSNGIIMIIMKTAQNWEL